MIVRRPILFGSIFSLPVLAQCVCDLRKPRPVFDLSQHLKRRVVFDAVRGRTPQRLEQLGRYQHRHIMSLTVSERSLATVRTAVREQWEQEQQAGRNETSTPKSPAKGKCLKPDGPER